MLPLNTNISSKTLFSSPPLSPSHAACPQFQQSTHSPLIDGMVQDLQKAFALRQKTRWPLLFPLHGEGAALPLVEYWSQSLQLPQELIYAFGDAYVEIATLQKCIPEIEAMNESDPHKHIFKAALKIWMLPLPTSKNLDPLISSFIEEKMKVLSSYNADTWQKIGYILHACDAAVKLLDRSNNNDYVRKLKIEIQAARGICSLNSTLRPLPQNLHEEGFDIDMPTDDEE